MENFDLTLQPILDWIHNGIVLEGAGAIAALGAFLRFVVIPAVMAISSRFFGADFYSIHKIHIINVAGILTTMFFAAITKSEVPFAQQILLGVIAANTAIGFHQTTTLAVKAADALQDTKRMQSAVAELAPVTLIEPQQVDFGSTSKLQ